MTTVYLIRHSVRMKTSSIETYKTNQEDIIKREKIILSVEGERRAEILSNEKELQDIDVIYTSNCVRTLQTAKYMMESQNLKANIDSRFDERRVGKINNLKLKDWFSKQYFDQDYKTVGGESQREVRKRFEEAFDEVIKKHNGKRIAIFSHEYAITFFLLKYCKLLDVDVCADSCKLRYEYKDKILFDKPISAPEVFKLTFENEDLINIELIEFNDLPYNHGV